MKKLSRRELLKFGALGAGGAVLRAIASGIPLGILTDPRIALAARALDSGAATTNPQFLLMASSGLGDPLNCHVPGTYDDPRIYHPASPLFASTPITMGSLTVKAAQTWTQLSSATLARTCFFHHATYSSVHGDESRVMSLQNGLTDNDMLVSSISSQLQGPLNTIQAAPLVLSNGTEVVTYKGSPVSAMSPASLSLVYGLPQLGPSNLQSIRDQTVDSLNTWAKQNATPAQRSYLDSFILSQSQARQVPDDLLAVFGSITDGSVQSQVRAAIALFKMRMSPTVVIHVPFGGDNHGDPGLQIEMADYDGNAPQSDLATTFGGKSGVAALADMAQQLSAAGLSDNVTFASLNVFGRTMGPGYKDGRSHNNGHHVAMMIGRNVAPSVVGGIVPFGPSTVSATAMGIDPTSGAASASGGIPFAETLGAFGKTLIRAVGLPGSTADTLVRSGQIVSAALAI